MDRESQIIKTTQIIAVFLSALFLFTIPQSSVYGHTEKKAIYPMDGINAQHNFQSNYSAKDNDGSLLDVKEFYSEHRIWVMDDRYIYTAKFINIMEELAVMKYDIQTGKVIWRTDNNFRFDAGAPCPAAFYNDTLYVYIGKGWRNYVSNYSTVPWSTESLWAISAKDGHVKWGYPALKVLADYYHLKRITTFGVPYYPLTVDNDGTIYIIAKGENIIRNSTGAIIKDEVLVAIIAVNPNGTTKWIFPVEKELRVATIPKGVAIDKYGNIYALSGRYLYALNKNGTLRWKVRMHFNYDGKVYGKYSRIGIYRDRIYFYGEANDSRWYLFAYTTDGKFLWKYQLEKEPEDIVPITKDGCVHPVIRYEDYSVVPTKNSCSHVYSITPNGTLKWKLNISRYIIHLVSDKYNYLYFSSSKYISDYEYLFGLYRISPDGSYKVLYETTKSVYHSTAGVFTCIGSNNKIYTIFYDGCYNLLYIFGDNPYGFLQNSLFISAMIVVIAAPVTYFVIKKRKIK